MKADLPLEVESKTRGGPLDVTFLQPNKFNRIKGLESISWLFSTVQVEKTVQVELYYYLLGNKSRWNS